MVQVGEIELAWLLEALSAMTRKDCWPCSAGQLEAVLSQRLDGKIHGALTKRVFGTSKGGSCPWQDTQVWYSPPAKSITAWVTQLTRGILSFRLGTGKLQGTRSLKLKRQTSSLGGSELLDRSRKPSAEVRSDVRIRPLGHRSCRRLSLRACRGRARRCCASRPGWPAPSQASEELPSHRDGARQA